MTQQLSYSLWGGVGNRDSQIALPLVGVWISMMVKCEDSQWGWCGLGTWIKCGMTLAKECDLFVVVFNFSWSFSRISCLCGFKIQVMETHNFGFVSAELHPRLFTLCLAYVYHHLEFASIS